MMQVNLHRSMPAMPWCLRLERYGKSWVLVLRLRRSALTLTRYVEPAAAAPSPGKDGA